MKAILAVLLACAVASGATYYMAPFGTGNDANDGQADTTGGGHGPVLTIGRAVALCSAGDTISIAAGNYTDSTGVAIAKPDNLRIIGAGSASTTITCTGMAANFIGSLSQGLNVIGIHFSDVKVLTGTSQSGIVTGVRFEDVISDGSSDSIDCIYTAKACLTLVNCSFSSHGDVLMCGQAAAGSVPRMDVVNCIVRVLDPPVYNGLSCCVMGTDQAQVTVSGSYLEAINTSPSNTYGLCGVQSARNANGTIVRVYDSRIYVANAGTGATYSLDGPGGVPNSTRTGTLIVDSATVYDRTKTTGTITRQASIFVGATNSVEALLGVPSVSLAADVAAVPDAVANQTQMKKMIDSVVRFFWVR